MTNTQPTPEEGKAKKNSKHQHSTPGLGRANPERAGGEKSGGRRKRTTTKGHWRLLEHAEGPTHRQERGNTNEIRNQVADQMVKMMHPPIATKSFYKAQWPENELNTLTDLTANMINFWIGAYLFFTKYHQKTNHHTRKRSKPRLGPRFGSLKPATQIHYDVGNRRF